MKTNVKAILMVGFLAASTIFSPSCQKIKDSFCNPAFDLDKFEENLIDELDGKVMGYAYVITDKGAVVAQGAGGLARAGNDGEKPMSVDERMQVASVSKSITTAATLSLLEDKGISVNAKVAPYLPLLWQKGPGFENVTFFELLNHSPGMNVIGTQSFNATRFDSLKFYVQQGATQPKTPVYSNTHHGMLRVILPKLYGMAGPSAGYDEDFCASAYKQIVQEILFDKINVANADCKPPVNSPLLAYSGPNDTSGNGGTADFSKVSGGTGWNLSCLELAKYWAYLWNTETFMSASMRNTMRDNELGLWNTIESGEHGDKYYCKLGGWDFNNTAPETQGNWMNSAVVQYPDGIQVTIFTNSPGPKGLSTVARDAYDNAFGCF